MAEIKIYTDGSSVAILAGGFGVILMWNNHRKEISKVNRLTTNNRMELLAVITGLESITKKITGCCLFRQPVRGKSY